MFDDIIGHIQDILLGMMLHIKLQLSCTVYTVGRYIMPCLMTCTDEGFSEVQSGFMEKYYSEFEDSEENKFTYTDIFKQYVSDY